MSLLNFPTQDSTQTFNESMIPAAAQVTDNLAQAPETHNWEYIGKSILQGLENAGKGGFMLMGGIAAQLGDQATADSLFDGIMQPSTITMPTPDQLSKGVETTGQVIKGLTPFFIPGIGLAAGATAIGTETAVNDLEAGVDLHTTTKHAVTAAGGAVAMAALGAAVGAGKTLAGTIGRQAAANVPTGMAQRAAEQVILNEYPDLAKQINILGTKEVGLDLALSVLFGGMTHLGAVKRVAKETGKSEVEAAKVVAKAEEVISSDVTVDDAVRVQQVHEQAKESNPLAAPDSYDQHMAAIDKAISDLDSGKPLDLTGIVDEAAQLRPDVVASVEGMAKAYEEAFPVTKIAPKVETVPKLEVLPTPEPVADPPITIKVIDESGKEMIQEKPASEAVKGLTENIDMVSAILNCVRGIE